MKKYLDYVPSWLDGASTLLDKINICIARVEQGVVTEETLQDVKELKESVATINTLIGALSPKVTKNTNDIAKNTNDIAKNTNDITKKQDILTAQTLESFVEGSDTVVVDLNESGNKINIHLENEVLNDITRSLKLPVNTPLETQVPVVLSNGSQAYENLSNIGNKSNKIYKHTVFIGSSGTISEAFKVVIYSTNQDKYTLESVQKVLDGKIAIITTGDSINSMYMVYDSEFIDNKISVKLYNFVGEEIEGMEFIIILTDYVTAI